MSGLIVRHAPHLDGSEPIGVWLDVAWSVYLDMGVMASKFRDGTTSVTELWESFLYEGDDGKPSPEQWGSSESAQRGQAAMMAMFGGSPDMNAAPSVGDEL
jgi:hypothetical protein